ncbi:MAG: hypothetical protein LBJ35_05400, partial [Spirochaetaceae bacterium]|nr:hypothetical protein [Spirochaetaceae bacterium]
GIAIAATPEFSWCFLFLALNTIISSYLYSTKRTKEAVIINVCRGLIFDPVIIMALPVLLGGYIVWFTAGIAEILTLAAALALLKHSEKGGITFR